MTPSVRFVTAPDGTCLACCAHGQGPPLVFVRNWVSHIELMWDDPLFRAYFEAIASCFTIVRYDMRSNGLSDRDVPPVTFEQTVDDLGAVIDELVGREQVVLYGQCFGGPTAIVYAATHPGRVTRLILDGAYASGPQITSAGRRARIISTLRELPEAGLLLMSHYTTPEARPTRFRQFEAPEAVERERAAGLYELGFTIDVSSYLPAIHMPTLVMHRRDTRAIPFRLGRALASAIPNARFVPLEGAAHNPWEEHPGQALSAIAEFLGVRFAAPEIHAPAIVLFTDLEASTATTQRIGDDAAHTILRAHNERARRAIRAHGGREIKHTGDGIMATFTSATSAIAAALEMQAAFADAELHVRIGLNAGEPVAEGDDYFGTAVQLARRICDAAEPGQIIVPDVMRQLAAGRGIAFAPLGARELKGFDEPVLLYEVKP
jgi:class 3 adenylate cyclase